MTTGGQIVQVGTAQTGGADSSGSFSVTAPSGLQQDDVLLVMGVSNEGVWDTLPSGFTQRAVSTDANTPNNFRVYFWTKTCSGSEPGSYSFGSTTAAGAGAPMVAIVSAWRNVDTSSPIMDSSLVNGGAIAEPANPATAFTQTANGLLFYFRAIRAGTTIATFTNGTANWTELADHGRFSGGSISYSGTLVVSDVNTQGGVSRSEPAVTCSQAETDNVYWLGTLRALPPADDDSGTGTESESGTSTGTDTDSGVGTETELVTIPIANSDSGVGTETDEDIVTQTHHYFGDNFNRVNESPLNVSSSGEVWTNV